MKSTHRNSLSVRGITENAKRSISFRMNTTDYGRVKKAAQCLRVRESDILRFLIAKGLHDLSALYDTQASQAELLCALIDPQYKLIEHLYLGVESIYDIINQRSGQSGVDYEDIERLAALFSSSDESSTAKIPAELENMDTDPDPLSMFYEYILGKYVVTPDH